MTDETETEMAEQIKRNDSLEGARDLERNSTGWCQALTADKTNRTELLTEEFPYHNWDMPSRSSTPDTLVSNNGNRCDGMATNSRIGESVVSDPTASVSVAKRTLGREKFVSIY